MTKPDFLLHIGMGKTGTTSLQEALRQNEDALAEQGVAYLNGMGETYPRVSDLALLLGSDDAEKQRVADELVAWIARKVSEGDATRFICSNEGFFGAPGLSEPIVRALQEATNLKVIAFVRHPADWLPSAHTQWGVKHKVKPGPVQGFETFARDYIKRYRALDGWDALSGGQMVVVPYEPGIDVIAAFCNVADIELPVEVERLLPRLSDTELLLRAAFNNRIETKTRPELYHDVVMNRDPEEIPELSELGQRIFDYSSADAVIADHSALFDLLKDRHGIDILGLKSRGTNDPLEWERVRTRLLDYVVHILLGNSSRLHTHSHRVEKLAGSIDGHYHRVERLATQTDDQYHRVERLATQTDAQYHRLERLATQIDTQFHRAEEMAKQLEEMSRRGNNTSKRVGHVETLLNAGSSLSQIDARDSQEQNLRRLRNIEASLKELQSQQAYLRRVSVSAKIRRSFGAVLRLFGFKRGEQRS